MKKVAYRCLLGLALSLIPGIVSVVEAQSPYRPGYDPRRNDFPRRDDIRPGSKHHLGGWEHVDELTLRISELSQNLQKNTYQYLREHDSYRLLQEHIREIEKRSQHLHEVAHHGKNVAHLREDVIRLDSEIHQTEELLEIIASRGLRTEHFDGGVRVPRIIVAEMLDNTRHLKEDLKIMDPTFRSQADTYSWKPGTERKPDYRTYQTLPNTSYHHPNGNIYRETQQRESYLLPPR